MRSLNDIRINIDALLAGNGSVEMLIVDARQLASAVETLRVNMNGVEQERDNVLTAMQIAQKERDRLGGVLDDIALYEDPYEGVKPPSGFDGTANDARVLAGQAAKARRP